MIEWNDETSVWIKQKDAKASNLIELAGNAVTNTIAEEPVENDIKEQNKILGATHEFDI